MEDLLNRTTTINFDNKIYTLISLGEKTQESGIIGYGFLFRVLDYKSDKEIGCISAFTSPTTLAVWRNHTQYKITEDNLKNLFLTVIPRLHFPISRSVLEKKHEVGSCIKVRIDTGDSGFNQNEPTMYIRAHESPEDFLRRHVYGGKITDEFVEKEILKLLYAYRESNEEGYRTKVLVENLERIMFLQKSVLLRNFAVLEDEELIDSVKSHGEYISVGITPKGVKYVRNNFKITEGGEVIMGDKVQGDKISAITHGDNSPNVIKSSNVDIIYELTNNLEQEIETKYDGEDKREILEEVRNLKELAKDKKNYPTIRSKLGGLLTKTSEIATIASLVAQLIQVFS